MNEDAGRPWGFWATIGFSLLIAAVYASVQAAVILGFMAAHGAFQNGADLYVLAEHVGTNGWCLALATIASAAVCIPLIVLIAYLRKGYSVREYLAFRSADVREFARWSLFLVILIIGGDFLTYVTGHRIVPDVMIDAYKTAYSLPVFFAVILVIAPVLEELFFRGFLFQGIRFSRLGAVPAVVLSALLWAIIHLQYDAFGMGTIFAGGLLIGVARLKTNSIYVPTALHSLNNLISTIQLVGYVHVLG